ncbi:DUF1501 domain-containing protein [Vibrio paucivorans]|uniref:DUF1501 domain-containing protein n=1 Tax=Vibrio paucivorans TaxID=2829489 RepID=A0A9X3CC51_9VIBR|nr:DUF1501 domain-containing protein [Vibrio paucivorans]MCW8332955.1 DUF1501 domain-containing protein [Vibrio paucivorans]
MTVSRRAFLKGSLSGVGVTAFNLSSPLAHALSPNCDTPAPQKALVGINLGGGNDGFNCFVPKADKEYALYRALRSNLAFEKDQLLDLNFAHDSLKLALSPELEAMKWLFDGNKAVPIVNVGPRMQPRERAHDIDKLKPIHLYSHNHQSAITQTYTGNSISNEGWGGRSAYLLETGYNLNELEPIFEVGSQSVWTNSKEKTANRIGTSMPPKMSLHNQGQQLFEAFRDKKMTSQSIFKQYYSELCIDAREKFDEFEKILVDEENCPYGFNLDTSLGKQLRVVLLLLLARDAFQHPAQFFSVTLGGFDTHSNQTRDQGELLRLLASQLSVFYRNLDQEGLTDSVTTFTFSEFGRTLIPNGSGTDHGWGNCQMVLGGDLNGNQVHGIWPDLSSSSADLLSRGRVVPTMSVDLFHATLLSWVGVKNDGIEAMFPTLVGYDPGAIPIFKSCGQSPANKLNIIGASASEENPNGIDKIAHGIDGDLNTKWSANGRNIEYTVELESVSTVTMLKFAQAKGDERRYYLDIEVSQDGIKFEDATSIDTAGQSDQMVEYPIGSYQAKYIRFVCQGNSDTNASLAQWNNFRHVEVWGQ